MELIPPLEGQSVFLVNHPSGCSTRRVACEKGWHEQLQGYVASLEDITHYCGVAPRAQEVLTRSLRILARCGVDVHVSSATNIWLATESAT